MSDAPPIPGNPDPNPQIPCAKQAIIEPASEPVEESEEEELDNAE